MSERTVPPNGWLAVCRREEIPRPGARVVSTDGGPVAVFRNGVDEVYALLNRCPHQGGPLAEGMVHGRLVTCPLHGWNIHLDRGEARAPDSGCVPRFEVCEVGGVLYLNPEPLPASAPLDGAAPCTA